MNTKLSFVAYPAVAALSLLAALAAHAQGFNNDADRAAYGPTVVNTTSAVNRAEVRAAAIAARDAALVNVMDKSGYGPTVVNTVSLRTRAEVRAEAIAARQAGEDAGYRGEGVEYLVALRPLRHADTAHVLAGAPAPAAR